MSTASHPGLRQPKIVGKIRSRFLVWVSLIYPMAISIGGHNFSERQSSSGREFQHSKRGDFAQEQGGSAHGDYLLLTGLGDVSHRGDLVERSHSQVRTACRWEGARVSTARGRGRATPAELEEGEVEVAAAAAGLRKSVPAPPQSLMLLTGGNLF